MAKGILSRLILVLLMLVVSLSCGVYLFAAELYLFSVMALFFAVWAFVLVIKTFSLNTDKATFMFNAIENDDFTFQFSENLRSHGDKMFNRSLNRIKDIMQHTRHSIAQREKYYETILDHSTSGIIVIDPNSGIIFQYNRAVEELLCISSLSHIGQLSAVAPDLPEILLSITPTESRSVSFYNETVKVCLTLSASLVWLNDRRLKIISMSDIGGQIDNAQTESWVRLSRVLTHEIMNSLAPITSLSEQLKSTTDPETLHRGLAIISTTGKGLIDFVDSYRRLTRIPTPVIEQINLKELLHKIVELLDAAVDMSRVSSQLTLQADANLITQVLTNLIKNAKEATLDGGQIWVIGRIDTRNRVVVEVCNNGEPILAEIRENIFVPFFTTKHGGSGVGLSISRQIMRRHNGTLTYANRVKDGQNVTMFILHF